MRVQINGESRDVPDTIDLAGLLEHLALPDRRIAVELNRQVVRRSEWPDRMISEGDKIEIVHFVGGG